jgi:hypothetical protein
VRFNVWNYYCYCLKSLFTIYLELLVCIWNYGKGDCKLGIGYKVTRKSSCWCLTLDCVSPPRYLTQTKIRRPKKRVKNKNNEPPANPETLDPFKLRELGEAIGSEAAGPASPVTPEYPSRPQTPETSGETNSGMTTPQGNPAGALAPIQMSMDQLQHLLQQLYHPPAPSNPKVEDPELDYGERPKLCAFLTQCELKFHCEPNKFDLDAKKVNYTSSRCRGNAWAWIEPSITKGQSSYKTWEEFKTAITQPFGEADSKEVASRKFNSIWQGNHSAAAYWAEFQRIMADLDYNDLSRSILSHTDKRQAT